LIVYPGETAKIQLLGEVGTDMVNGKDCEDLRVPPEEKNFSLHWGDSDAHRKFLLPAYRHPAKPLPAICAESSSTPLGMTVMSLGRRLQDVWAR
jgi:hypothetical protein